MSKCGACWRAAVSEAREFERLGLPRPRVFELYLRRRPTHDHRTEEASSCGC